MAIGSHPRVIVYTTPTCPDCRTLKAWLEREGIAFEERDLTDPKIMAEAKARTGVRVAPITLVDWLFPDRGTSQTCMQCPTCPKAQGQPPPRLRLQTGWAR